MEDAVISGSTFISCRPFFFRHSCGWSFLSWLFTVDGLNPRCKWKWNRDKIIKKNSCCKISAWIYNGFNSFLLEKPKLLGGGRNGKEEGRVGLGIWKLEPVPHPKQVTLIGQGGTQAQPDLLKTTNIIII